VLTVSRLGNNREQSIRFLREKASQRNWKDVKIVAFDAPQVSDSPYVERLKLLQQSK
jgi:hypothetical protein